MRCPLNDQVNTMSREWSWDTWQGRTMLSPTVTSMLKGDTMTRVGSTDNKERGEKKDYSCSPEEQRHCRAERDPKQWSLRKVLKSTSELFHLWVYPFSSCWIKTLLINPPESSSSHHPDEEGRKKRLEKSAADLKGLVKTFYQRFFCLNLLTSKSCFTLTRCSPRLSNNYSVVPKLNVKSPKLEWKRCIKTRSF